MSTLITLCSKKKKEDRDSLPALLRYDSDRIRFVHGRAIKEKHSMFIFSGLLGLIQPETQLMWYDKLLVYSDAGPLVDLVSHQLLQYHIDEVEYVTENIWINPNSKPYQDVMAAACMRMGVTMIVTEYM